MAYEALRHYSQLASNVVDPTFGFMSVDWDGLVPALLAAEITARYGRDPAQLYEELAQALVDRAIASP